MYTCAICSNVRASGKVENNQILCFWLITSIASTITAGTFWTRVLFDRRIDDSNASTAVGACRAEVVDDIVLPAPNLGPNLAGIEDAVLFLGVKIFP